MVVYDRLKLIPREIIKGGGLSRFDGLWGAWFLAFAHSR
jgi:hypothetical protein